MISNLAGLLIIFKSLKQVLQRLSNVREIVDKVSIKVAKSKENLDILIRLQLGPFKYNLNTGQIHLNALFINDKV